MDYTICRLCNGTVEKHIEPGEDIKSKVEKILGMISEVTNS